MQYGLIGEHLSHSHSKRIHERLGSYSYELKSIPREEIAAFLEARDFQGLNVTIPYKQTVIPFCDALTEAAEAIGSVNTLVMKNGKLLGDNTDYAGFLYLARRAGISFAGKKVLLCGSGGTSKTVSAAVRAQGAREVVILSRSGEDNYQNAKERHGDAEVLINTTPVGMYPHREGQPILLEGFSKLVGVLDVVYNPLSTRLVQEAREKGICAAGGLSMLVAQAKYAAEQFSGETISDAAIATIEAELRHSLSNLVLIGMPSSGKTSLGKLCAERLGREFLDLDSLIEERAGQSIPTIFAKQGEQAFRDLETEVIRSVADQNNLVIATGGGAVLREENLAALRANGVIVRITRPIALLSTEGRPISQQQALSVLAAEREPYYQRAAQCTVENADRLTDAAARIVEGFYEILNFERP